MRAASGLSDTPARARGGVLEPVERLSELLFGLFMVLGFTGSLSAAEAGHAEVRTMLFGALGCNLAWGIIDALMYLMAQVSERNIDRRLARAVRDAASPAEGRAHVGDELPATVAHALGREGLEQVRTHLAGAPGLPPRARLTAADWWGALAVCLIVFASTVPVVIPFRLIPDALPALRVSNAVAIVLLFLTGYAFGQVAHLPRLGTGLAMVFVGGVLVAVTMALGG